VRGSPEELLRSALEKIVFFECKVSSLESELDAARAAAARAREEAGSVRRRETEHEQELAKLRGEQASALEQAKELGERVELLQAERERFLSGMVERARVAGAPTEDDEDPGSAHDLAGFIAELRAEIARLEEWRRAAQAAGIELEPKTPSASAPEAAKVSVVASRFEEAGRIGVTREQVGALPAFSTRSERVLFEASLDDLGASDKGVRRRAAEGLRALGSKSAAPLLAVALGRETEPEVKVSLLSALGALGEPSAASLALRELSDERPPVRAAALESAAALDREGTTPRLARALGDPSALVRRRAAVLLGFTPGEAAEQALAAALADRDPGVARTAAVALSGRPSALAQGALARALDHPVPEVRRTAARAVGRWSGELVDASAPEPERRRAARRIAEKLLAVGGSELRTAVTKVAVRAPVSSTRPRSPSPEAAPRAKVAPAAAPQPEVRVAAVMTTGPDPSLAAAAIAEVRTALRGRTAEEMAEVLRRDRAAVEATLRTLVAEGALVARGPRFFMS